MTKHEIVVEKVMIALKKSKLDLLDTLKWAVLAELWCPSDEYKKVEKIFEVAKVAIEEHK